MKTGADNLTGVWHGLYTYPVQRAGADKELSSPVYGGGGARDIRRA